MSMDIERVFKGYQDLLPDWVRPDLRRRLLTRAERTLQLQDGATASDQLFSLLLVRAAWAEGYMEGFRKGLLAGSEFEREASKDLDEEERTG